MSGTKHRLREGLLRKRLQLRCERVLRESAAEQLEEVVSAVDRGAQDYLTLAEAAAVKACLDELSARKAYPRGWRVAE